jgi:hypothetical protein
VGDGDVRADAPGVKAARPGGRLAQTGLLFSPILFASLLVGKAGTDAIPATVLATVATWLTKAAIDCRSKAAQTKSTSS